MSLSTLATRYKKTNWSELERKIDLFEGKYFILFGKFKGAGGGKIDKMLHEGKLPRR